MHQTLRSSLLGLLVSTLQPPASATASADAYTDAFSVSALSWTDASQAASDFVSQLTTLEKIGLVTGSYSYPTLPCVGTIAAIERLNFTGLCLSDGPSGYARTDGVSVFGSGITAAATWDRRLIYDRALAIGEEFRAKGAHVHLGPSTGPMGRHAEGGRNWEGFGPDPFLAGAAMNASVRGIQAAGVQTCSKHLIGNEQETQRSTTNLPDGTVIDAISANIDDRTLHELYLWPFADAVRAGTTSVMCAYNRVNGTYSCESSHILRSILKDELAFPGYILSDWSATHSTDGSVNAGLDMEMPGNVTAGPGTRSWFGDYLLTAIEEGLVSEDRLDDMAKRVMAPYFLLRQDENFPSPDPGLGASFLNYQYGHDSPLAVLYPEVEARDVRANHARSIRELAAAGTVLLKNNGALPLKGEKNIGLFGNDAPFPTIGSVDFAYGENAGGNEMGTLIIGGGSGTVRHTSLITPQDAIQAHVRSLGGRLQMLFDNNAIAEGLFKTVFPTPDVCLLLLKSFAGEGSDRPGLDFQWNATMAVESTAKMCSNTVVITHGPGVALMPWADNPNVTAILAAHYPGEETGNAIVDVLWGAVEPSGRLPYSIPYNAADYGPQIVSLENATDPNAWQADYVEGQMIDYRHFDEHKSKPRYPFGFGLSYTTFDMDDNLNVHILNAPLAALPDESRGIAPGGLVDLWEVVIVATVNVTNTGERDGTTVPQLYLSLPQDSTPPGTPLKVLRGFQKLHLAAGETTQASFELTRRDLSYWDVSRKTWVIPDGFMTFMAGFSSDSTATRTVVEVLG